MSYILDALRKAERERGIRQVPTLMTNHAPRSVNRNRIWAALIIVLVCAAAFAWLLVNLQREPDRIAKGAGPNQTAASNTDRSTPASAPSLKSPADQSAQFPSEKSAGAGIAPQTQLAPVPRDVTAKKPAAASRPRNQQNEEEDLMFSDEEDEGTIPPAEVLRSLQRGETGPAGAEEVKAEPVSLKEAVGKMTLSLLMFADTKEERMVFIDGNKYAEGDRVDGIYLLESITIDGAILSYQGERALLKPKSK